MNAERLTALYDRVSDTPDAVVRLRRFVLDLAVRGMLVKQDPADEPASELLERIAVERQRMINAGEIRKPRYLRNGANLPSTVPFDVPDTWVWSTLGTVFLYDAGIKRDPKTLDPHLWLLDLKDIEKDTGQIIAKVKSADRVSRSTKSEFLPGDILYGKLRPYLNKVVVADEPGYSTTEIVAIRPYVPLCSKYCALALRRSDFLAHVTMVAKGTKMPRLRSKDAIDAPFPLPPLSEQRRIVAKVEELMALCDRLQEIRAARERTRDRLTKASYARLSASDADASSFRAHARFVVRSLPALTARADQVKQLRQTVLDLAVRGKLVEQDPTDESASELLERVTSGAGNGEGATSYPFGMLGALCDINIGRTPRRRESRYWGGSHPWATIRDLNGGTLTSTRERITDAAVNEAMPEPAKANTLLFSFKLTIGKMAFASQAMYYNEAIAALPIRYPTILDSAFLFYALKAKNHEGTANHAVKGKTLNKRKVAQIRVPLPPLAEQHRIVAKVEELMALCDQMEASLNVTDSTRRRFLVTLLHESLTPYEAPSDRAGDVARIGA